MLILSKANFSFSSIITSDIFGDNDNKLIIGNLDARLSIFRNMILHSELELLGIPSSICALYQGII